MILIAGPRYPGIFLAYSKDSGETWFDISNSAESVLGQPGIESLDFSVGFIYEDENGGVFVGVVHRPTHSIKIIRVRIDIAAFR